MATTEVVTGQKDKPARVSSRSRTLGRLPFTFGFVGVLALAFVVFALSQAIPDPAMAIGIALVGGIACYILMALLVIRRARHAGQMWLAWLTLIPIPLPFIRWAFIAALLIWPEKKAYQPASVPVAAVA